ncbi:MAG TPA: CPBP family intramembrane metalloprotease [Candidatus Agrococcus pullicola]|uniref:CPBP family intramembrane metalloprotease n=1 Tax=Candidatus Agrococcus pullicola TaxID=2838429 RepID=A0A9D1YV13_9MICO|nr:CPBP family intramembrane metalloprotease [Candidatus Agrococcus pullicola]
MSTNPAPVIPTSANPVPQDPPGVDSAEPTRVPWPAVAVYTVLACGLAWLVTIPLWLGDGLADPKFTWLVLLMMYTPTVAALIVTFFIVKPKYKARYLGLTPFKPVVRSIVLILVWPIVFGLLAVSAAFVASLFGWVDFGFNASALEEDAALAGMSAEALALLSIAMTPLIVVQATFAAFGEELGWRGFLVPALKPLGFWPMAIISGVIWGVWHAPIILLGYNFGRTDIFGVLLMIVFCFFVGVILNWSRLWCRNVWVAAVGHGALNATAPIGFLFVMNFDPAGGLTQTVVGAPGWIIMAAIIVVMAGLGLFGKRLPKPLVTVPAKHLSGGHPAPRGAGVSNPTAEPAVGTPEWAQGYVPHTRNAPDAPSTDRGGER